MKKIIIIFVLFFIDRLSKIYLINLQDGGTDVDFKNMPICIESTNKSDYLKLENLVKLLGSKPVSMDSNKPLIKEAVEALFNVKVKAVNTTVVKGKTKRFKGQLGKRKNI